MTLLVAAIASGLIAPAEQDALLERARAIHARVVTVDAHVDIPFDFATEAVDPGTRGSRQVDLPKMVEGGLDAAFFNVYVAQERRGAKAYEKYLERQKAKTDEL